MHWPLDMSYVVSKPAKVSARLAMGMTWKVELTCSPTLLTWRIRGMDPDPPPSNMVVRLEAVSVAVRKRKSL